MVRRFQLCILCVEMLFLSLTAGAAEHRYITTLRTESGFATWPGKGGPLKKGLNFLPSDYPDLAGFSIVSEDFLDGKRDLGLFRKIRLSRDNEILTLVIGLAHTSTDDAHELLLLHELALSQMDFAVRLKRGDSSGVQVGDFNFVLTAATPTDLKGYIAFVRNNVVCVIKDVSPANPSNVDLRQVAVDIDAKITTLPNLTPTEFNTLKPNITAFSPANDTLVVGSSTTLNIAVSDPSGERIRRKLSSAGKLQIDTSVDPVRIRPTGVIGVIPIELIAINDSLQFSTAQTSVTVMPR